MRTEPNDRAAPALSPAIPNTPKTRGIRSSEFMNVQPAAPQHMADRVDPVMKYFRQSGSRSTVGAALLWAI